MEKGICIVCNEKPEFSKAMCKACFMRALGQARKGKKPAPKKKEYTVTSAVPDGKNSESEVIYVNQPTERKGSDRYAGTQYDQNQKINQVFEEQRTRDTNRIYTQQINFITKHEQEITVIKENIQDMRIGLRSGIDSIEEEIKQLRKELEDTKATMFNLATHNELEELKTVVEAHIEDCQKHYEPIETEMHKEATKLLKEHELPDTLR